MPDHLTLLMIRLLAFVICWLAPLYGFSQDKPIKQSTPAPKPKTTLESDESKRDGRYMTYFPIPQEYQKKASENPAILERYVKQETNYSNGVLNGFYAEFSTPKFPKELGYYSNGSKSGIWTTALLVKSDSVLIYKRFDFSNSKELRPIVRVLPGYPVVALRAIVQGTVIRSYHQRPDCSVYDVKIIKSLSPECDAAATKALYRRAILLNHYWGKCSDSVITDTTRFIIK